MISNMICKSVNRIKYHSKSFPSIPRVYRNFVHSDLRDFLILKSCVLEETLWLISGPDDKGRMMCMPLSWRDI